MILKYLEGYAPLPERTLIVRRDRKQFDPPAGLVKKLDGFGVWCYLEKNARGDTFEVVCFACDIIWMKTWVSIDLGDEQRIVPDLDGPRFLRHPIHKHLTCPCEASRFMTRNLPEREFAGFEEISEALDYDLQLTSGIFRGSKRKKLDEILGSAGRHSLGG